MRLHHWQREPLHIERGALKDLLQLVRLRLADMLMSRRVASRSCRFILLVLIQWQVMLLLVENLLVETLLVQGVESELGGH